MDLGATISTRSSLTYLLAARHAARTRLMHRCLCAPGLFKGCSALAFRVNYPVNYC